jgi:hypothetical protein
MKSLSRQNSASVTNGYNSGSRVNSATNRSNHSAVPATTTIIQPNQPINDSILNRFIEIQTHTEEYERKGIFEGLKIAEEEFEALEKSKRQAEINHKVLLEQTKKEKQDFDNISQLTVASYFKDKQAHSKAISKEQEEYLHSLNLSEIAANELKAISEQCEHSKQKLDKYKRENQKAIDLYSEQMNILCMFVLFYLTRKSLS